MFETIAEVMAQTVGIGAMLAGVAMIGTTIYKALLAHIRGE